MAKGGLFSRYRKKIEEIRINTLSPEELKEESLAEAGARVTAAHKQLEDLKAEWAQMDEKHCLSMQGFTLVIGRYSPGQPDLVFSWFRDWTDRSHKAQVEFNESLAIYAGLKLQS